MTKPQPFTPPEPMTVQQVLSLGIMVLKNGGIEGAARDARLFMAASLDIDPDRVTLHMPDKISPDGEAAFMTDIRQRVLGKPVSHILGKRMFYGRTFEVTPDVLDPRPETEELVAAALEQPWDSVLDLGTGSGCILITLLAERPRAHGIGTDLSAAALDIANRNAMALEVQERLAFEPSDWFGAVGGTFDLIVSNPPYIAADEMAGLSAEVGHEPRMALTDEGDGLTCYRIIAAGAPQHLKAGGWLMVEIGPTQGAAVSAMFNAAGLTQIEIRPDLDGRDRVVVGQKPL